MTIQLADETNAVEKKEALAIQQEIGGVPSPVKVIDSETMTLADNRVAKATFAIKVIEEKLGPRRDAAHKLHKSLTSLIAEMSAPWKEDRDFHIGQVKAYQRKVREEAEAEQRRLAEIARKQEEERRLAEAIEAEKEGNVEEAQAIIEEEMFVPTPIVRPDVPKVDGRKYATKWSWKVTDINKVPREYLIVDQIKMNGIVRAMKGQTRISGIEVFEE
jgi:hypothetical protein